MGRSTSFYDDLWRLPKEVQKRVSRAVTQIQQDPFRGGGHVRRCFKHLYSDVYRYRLGDYRLIYSVGQGAVMLLACDTRGGIYKRFHVDPDDLRLPPVDWRTAVPQPFGTTPYDAPRMEYPDGPDSDEPEDGRAASMEGDGPALEKPPPSKGDPHATLLRDLLGVWGVPDDQHDAILRCHRAEEIIDLDLPDEIKERILNIQQPPTVEEIAEQPNYELKNPDDLDRYVEGSLKRFLLDLDPEQERVASRSLRGPTLVQGGPGTGKSLVALHRIRNLLTPDVQSTLFEGEPPSILMVTFGKALMRASEQLLEELLETGRDRVTVTNLDRLVHDILVDAGDPHAPLVGRQRRIDFLEAALEATKVSPHLEAALASVRELRPDYLLDEFDWVLEGRNLTDLADYVAEDRSGRGIRLDRRQREAVWALHQTFLRLLAEEGLGTFNLYRRRALELMRDPNIPTPSYDVVIVDEAQDLPPVGLSLCAELCRDPAGLFFTADPAQSIYSKGFSWSRVHAALRFRGRATVLRRNYRSTRQIADAARQILAGHEGVDSDSLSAEPVREGPRPLMIPCSDLETQAQAVAHFLRKAAAELRVPVWYGAVLVPANSVAKKLADRLEKQGLPARAVATDDFDLSERAVKVMTIHAAKGLEFPFVVVSALDRKYIPKTWNVTDPDDRKTILDDERKLVFVALSRAMRRLAITFTESGPSPYVRELDEGLWERASWGGA